ncbi:hypothetical protein JW859_11455 [bacterium]|nr:hypothetical protein [bacterium]
MARYGLLSAAILVMLLCFILSADDVENPYLGDNAKKCGMCHKDQAAAWQEWPMASSWDKLSAEEQQDENCIPCHVTGYGQPGGWISFEETPQLTGIQCEACHGPGTLHMKVPIKDVEAKKASLAIPDEANCLQCHIEEGNPNFKEFKYDEAVTGLSDHFKAEEAEEAEVAEDAGATEDAGEAEETEDAA